MATLVPSLNSCLGKMQAGEKRFARRLEALLEDDYLCWYELPVGKRQRYTDFIILHPGRGLLLLESTRAAFPPCAVEGHRTSHRVSARRSTSARG